MSAAQQLRELIEQGDLTTLASRLEQLELDCAAVLPQATAFPYYSLLLAVYLAQNDLNNARFLWKRAPADAKKGTELAALWEVGKALWKKDYPGFYRAANSSWSAEVAPLVQQLIKNVRARMLEFVPTSFTAIRIDEFAALLGESVEAAIKLGESKGWSFDSASRLLSPTAPPTTKLRKTGLQQLRQLTDYVISLEM